MQNNASESEKSLRKRNKVATYACKLDVVISAIFLIAISIYWILLIPVSAYRVRLTYAIMHPAYLITYTIFFIYLGVFVAKVINKIFFGNSLATKCTVPLYADFVSLLLGFMIIFGSKVLLIGLIPFQR